MALSRVKTWIADEVLSASNLNAEFNNILNNALSLISPITGTLDLDGKELILDADADSSLTADTDDVLDIRLQGADLFKFDGSIASATTGLTFAAAATASPNTVTITAVGATNTNINIVPDGTGVLQSGGAAVLLNVVEDTTPQLGADLDLNAFTINDTNGAEIFTYTATGSALNQVHFTSGATTADATITAEGETNVGIKIFGKAAGTLKLGDANLVWPDADGNANEVIETDGSGNLSFVAQTTAVAQADQTAVEAETNENTYVPPDLLNFHPGIGKVLCNWQVDGTVDASQNVDSVTDTGVGDWTVNITTDFSAITYTVLASCDPSAASTNRSMGAVSPAAGTCQIVCETSLGARADPGANELHMAAFGDQ